MWRLRKSIFSVFALLLLYIGCKKTVNEPEQQNLTNDYFPLSVGNSWEYDYHGKSADGPNGGSITSGTITWTIIGAEQNNYKMEAHNNLTIIQSTSANEIKVDTIYKNNTDTVSISENNNMISTNVDYSLGLFCKDNQVERFLPNTTADTVKIINDYPIRGLWIVKNLGMISYSASAGHGSFWGMESYRLIRATIK